MPQELGRNHKRLWCARHWENAVINKAVQINLGSFVGQSTSLKALRLQEAQVCSRSVMP